jgi:DNA-binding protein YbaB
MTDNPFEGMGGFDMNALLQQAQQMQDQVTQAQARLGDETVRGSVAGGAVTVTLSGLGDLVGVTIRPGTVDGDSADDLADLGDLLVAAYRDAKTQADRLAAEALGPFGGGGLPGLG